MYISLTGNSNNKDVYIKRSYRKTNGKTATQIHRKLGKLNELFKKTAERRQGNRPKSYAV